MLPRDTFEFLGYTIGVCYRPKTGTRLLIATLQSRTGVKVGLSTMSRALKLLGARRRRLKPTVECPWPEAENQAGLREIDTLIAEWPANDVAVSEDEVDIHLNPKIGQDWMVRGQRTEVPTAGKNEKRYLAGAQQVRTKELIMVNGERKNTALFVLLLRELTQRVPKATRGHVILDNEGIPASRRVEERWATPLGRKLRLHVLLLHGPETTGSNGHGQICTPTCPATAAVSAWRNS